MKILKCHQQCADLQQVLLFASLINVGSVRQFFLLLLMNNLLFYRRH